MVYAVGDAPTRRTYPHEVFKDGSQYISVSGATAQIDYIGTSLSDLLNQIKAVDGSGGKTIALYPGVYSMGGTVTYDNDERTTPLLGLGHRFRTVIEPSTDVPCFELDAVPYIHFENIQFANNLATFNSPFVRIKDGCTWNTWEDCMFINNVGDMQGIGVEFKGTVDGQMYNNVFKNCWSRNLNVAWNFDTTTASDASPWITSNIWDTCLGFWCYNWVKVRQKTGTFPSGGSFAWNVWNDCHVQSKRTVPKSDAVYDFDGNGFIQVALVGGTMQWDLEKPTPALLVPTTGWLWIDGTKDLVGRIGGSGVNSPTMKISVGSEALRRNQGTATFTGTGAQTDFVITHNNDWYYEDDTPQFVKVWAKSPDALDAVCMGVIPSSVTPELMTVRFQRPPRLPNPAGGSNNVIVGWEVQCI